jgi:hypothetical protein
MAFLRAMPVYQGHFYGAAVDRPSLVNHGFALRCFSFAPAASTASRLPARCGLEIVQHDNVARLKVGAKTSSAKSYSDDIATALRKGEPRNSLSNDASELCSVERLLENWSVRKAGM